MSQSTIDSGGRVKMVEIHTFNPRINIHEQFEIFSLWNGCILSYTWHHNVATKASVTSQFVNWASFGLQKVLTISIQNVIKFEFVMDKTITFPNQNCTQLNTTRTTRTPTFWGYPRRLMITHTTQSYWIPSQNKVEWPWIYRSMSRVITCDKPSGASDHLYQIWKESIQNSRRYRADTIFKVKAEWPWKYRSRSKVITCDTPSDANDDLCQIWKECKQNCRFFKRWKPKN